MISFRRLGLVLAAALLTLAQATPPAPPATDAAPAPAKDPGTLHITLMDGSSVTGKFAVNELAIDTKFGPLKVPLDSVKSFSPGLHSHPEFEARLNKLIADLSGDAFVDRDKAQDALIKIGPEIKGELERQLKTAEAEKEMRLQKILEDFENGNGDDETPTVGWVADDVIVTEGFTIVGHVTTTNFTVNSPYGVLNLKLSDLRDVKRDAGDPEELHKTITVPGTLIATHAFISTGLHLNHGDQVIITATGTIRMTPFGGNQVSSPDGGQRFGMQQPENVFGGTLMGRIKGSDNFKVGTKYSGPAPKAGTLELGIAMPSDFGGDQFPGEYTVKIRVIRKAGP